MIDVSGAGLDADSAARAGLAAALRSWRYDRYRTKLKDKQKPTLNEVTIVGGAVSFALIRNTAANAPQADPADLADG